MALFYLGRKDKGVQTFPKGISLKVNVNWSLNSFTHYCHMDSSPLFLAINRFCSITFFIFVSFLCRFAKNVEQVFLRIFTAIFIMSELKIFHLSFFNIRCYCIYKRKFLSISFLFSTLGISKKNL